MPRYDKLRKIDRNNAVKALRLDHPDWSCQEIADAIAPKWGKVSRTRIDAILHDNFKNRPSAT